PVAVGELGELFVGISVLGPPEPMDVGDEGALIAALSPGDDGLVLSFREVQATFLPTVWATLPDPRLFVLHLKRKAGLPPDFWSPELRISRYHTESFSDAEMGEDDVG
ncbi:MAG TPA: AMMECR1 domain-containing protein, partial [Gammaproteobacteria bacterium]|nr:AMMECR1 domain-containing protein [Gammaproteobacteria bacterium]